MNKFSTYIVEIHFAGRIINSIREILDEETIFLITDGINSSINIQNISFGYDTEYILHNISLSAHSGSMIVLVGPPGSVKSTLASLVARLWE